MFKLLSGIALAGSAYACNHSGRCTKPTYYSPYKGADHYYAAPNCGRDCSGGYGPEPPTCCDACKRSYYEKYHGGCTGGCGKTCTSTYTKSCTGGCDRGYSYADDSCYVPQSHGCQYNSYGGGYSSHSGYGCTTNYGCGGSRYLFGRGGSTGEDFDDEMLIPEDEMLEPVDKKN